jgi:hypothetical protein
MEETYSRLLEEKKNLPQREGGLRNILVLYKVTRLPSLHHYQSVFDILFFFILQSPIFIDQLLHQPLQSLIYQDSKTLTYKIRMHASTLLSVMAMTSLATAIPTVPAAPAAAAAAAAAPLNLTGPTDVTANDIGPGYGIAKSVYIKCLNEEVWHCMCFSFPPSFCRFDSSRLPLSPVFNVTSFFHPGSSVLNPPPFMSNTYPWSQKYAN